MDKAKLLLDINDNKKALTCLQKCLEIDKDGHKRADILYLMVFANFKLNNYLESIDLLQELIRAKPDLQYINGLGECMIKVEKYK